MSCWHELEPDPPTSGYRRLVPIARPSARPYIGRSTSQQWKRGSTIAGRIQLKCSALGLLIQFNHLRENPVCEDREAGGAWLDMFARQRHVQAVILLIALQRSRLQLTWRALHRLANGQARNTNIVNASAACSSLTCPCAFTLGTRSLARVSILCRRFSPDSPCGRRCSNWHTDPRQKRWSIGPLAVLALARVARHWTRGFIGLQRRRVPLRDLRR